MAADGNRALMPLPKQVEEVVYWTNPLVSGGVFLVGLFAFYLVGLCNYSSISVVCYVLILNLTVRSSSSGSGGRASTTSTLLSHLQSKTANPNPNPNPDPNPNQVRLAHMHGGRMLGEMNV